MKQKFARKIAFALSAITSIGFVAPAFAENADKSKSDKDKSSIQVIVDSIPYTGSLPKNVKVSEIYSNNLTKATNATTYLIQKSGSNINFSSVSKKSLIIVSNFSNNVAKMKSAIEAEKAGSKNVSNVELLGAFITDKNGKSKLEIIDESDMAQIAIDIKASAIEKASETKSAGGGNTLSKSEETKAIANGWN